MSGKPTGAVSVGVLPLSPLFPDATFTVYTVTEASGPVGFVDAASRWTTIISSTPVQVTTGTGDKAATTVNVWYNDIDKVLGFYSVALITQPGTPATTTLHSIQIQLMTSSPTNTVTSSIASTGNLSSGVGTGAPASQTDPTTSPTSPGQSGAPLSTSTSTKSSGSKDGLSAGAVAGVAIGCLLAGALVAGLLAFFFLKKRRPVVRDSEASSTALIHREKGPAVKTMSLESGSPIAGALEHGLPLPLEDKAISGEISKISNLIKNHVQSYYHAGRVSPVSIDYDDLQALGDDMPVSVGTLSTLLGNSATRETALRFCIAWIVISRMQLRSPPNMTFLPPEVSQCVQMMNIGDRGSKVHATYLSRWRAITAELMQSVYVRNPFSSTDARANNLQLAANLLNSVLRPYSDSRMDDGQRSRNLEEILKRSAQFAFTLFSQPSTWDFDWENGQDVKSGSLCIFPALVQVRDDNGELIKPARPFSEAVIRRLDE